MKSEEFVEIGFITKTHGLKGDIQIAFTYHEPEKLKMNSVFLEINGKKVPYFVDSFKLSQQTTGYLKFEDIDHIDKAQILVKRKVFLPLKMMPKKKKEEFTFKDLEGFSVLDKINGDLGKILSVREYPQQFLATVNYQEKEVLFPLSDAFIEDIDIENRKLSVNLPEGLLEVYLDQNN
ncbi:ribosome maturation factor RimM [Pseudopedobacter beijingensis]|uniref:Ribosome maturation factor RimM n=1 Tax=Pseudopedobacter beijingensis TaxID=1207056 RepID=A0ABW4ICK0_9SPHI